MPTFISNICPVCSCRNFKNIGPADLGQIPLGQIKTNIVNCLRCSSYYANPLPSWSKDEFNLLYGKDYFKENLENSIYNELYNRLHNENINFRYSVLKKYLMDGVDNTMLEFGAGIQARMAKFLLENSWGSVTIQEPSMEFSSILKSANPNINIINEDFLDISNYKYDLIYADSVLEHTPNPRDYIAKASSMLKTGGCLYLVVPNEHSFLNYLTSTYYSLIGRGYVKYLCPYTVTYHLIGFSKKGIYKMAQDYGFEVVYHLKGRDHSWLRITHLNKPLFIKYPAAFLLSIADFLGFGVNQEFVLKKI
jgi:SAM-dependent methyltransferase